VIQNDVAELRCSECRGKNQMSIVHGRWCDKHVFQHGELVVHCLDELLQTRNRHPKVYESHAITVLEGKHGPSFIVGVEIVIGVIMKNDEWKGRVMCQHFCHGRAT